MAPPRKYRAEFKKHAEFKCPPFEEKDIDVDDFDGTLTLLSGEETFKDPLYLSLFDKDMKLLPNAKQIIEGNLAAWKNAGLLLREGAVKYIENRLAQNRKVFILSHNHKDYLLLILAVSGMEQALIDKLAPNIIDRSDIAKYGDKENVLKGILAVSKDIRSVDLRDDDDKHRLQLEKVIKDFFASHSSQSVITSGSRLPLSAEETSAPKEEVKLPPAKTLPFFSLSTSSPLKDAARALIAMLEKFEQEAKYAEHYKMFCEQKGHMKTNVETSLKSISETGRIGMVFWIPVAKRYFEFWKDKAPEEWKLIEQQFAVLDPAPLTPQVAAERLIVLLNKIENLNDRNKEKYLRLENAKVGNFGLSSMAKAILGDSESYKKPDYMEFVRNYIANWDGFCDSEDWKNIQNYLNVLSPKSGPELRA